MGWASNILIEQHNALMESDADYAEQCRREWELEDYCRELAMENENLIDFFDDYKLSHDGYEEFQAVTPNADFVDDEDLPF